MERHGIDNGLGAVDQCLGQRGLKRLDLRPNFFLQRLQAERVKIED